MRVATNYLRLAASFIIGLVIVRVLLGFGEAYGMLLLVTTTSMGMVWLREALYAGVTPELGKAYHTQDSERLREIYCSSVAIAVAAGAAAFAVICGTLFLLPCLAIPPHLLGPARFLMGSLAVLHGGTLALAPTIITLLVAEKVVAYNAVALLQRVADLVAAVVAIACLHYWSMPSALLAYAVGASVGPLAVQMIAAALLVAGDPRLRFRASRVSPDACRSIARHLGWNSIVTLSNNLYLRVDAIVINVTFGVMGNLVFGVAMQLAAYIRQLTSGLVIGLEAAASRLAHTTGRRGGVELLRSCTRSQSAIILPACGFLIVFTESILRAWIGDRLEDPQTSLPAIATLVRWIVLGIGARALADGWIKMLVGEGAIRLAAPILLTCALANPVLVVVLIRAAPPSWGLSIPAICYALLSGAAYLVLLPPIVARRYEVDLLTLYGPMARAACCAGLSILPVAVFSPGWRHEFAWVVVSGLIVCCCYLGCFWRIGLSSQERTALVSVARERLLGGSRRAANEPASRPGAPGLRSSTGRCSRMVRPQASSSELDESKADTERTGPPHDSETPIDSPLRECA